MLYLVPVSLKEANAFVTKYHRHHKATQGHKFSIGCMNEKGVLIGVVIVGRPVSRYYDDGLTIEVTRLCTDGTKNACSFLYSAAARAATAMGYRRIITYILESECGTSLRASGWTCEGSAGGVCWTGVRKPDKQEYPHEMKQRYVKDLVTKKSELLVLPQKSESEVIEPESLGGLFDLL